MCRLHDRLQTSAGGNEIGPGELQHVGHRRAQRASVLALLSTPPEIDLPSEFEAMISRLTLSQDGMARPLTDDDRPAECRDKRAADFTRGCSRKGELPAGVNALDELVFGTVIAGNVELNLRSVTPADESRQTPH
jgi:hypothetical protein